MAHMEICVRFEVEDRRYEAIGFLGENEKSVDGDIMLSRTAGDMAEPFGDEDEEAFLSKRQSKFPEELRKYYLVTNQRSPGRPHRVSNFYWHVGKWLLAGDDLNHQWNASYLVLRRIS